MKWSPRITWSVFESPEIFAPFMIRLTFKRHTQQIWKESEVT